MSVERVISSRPTLITIWLTVATTLGLLFGAAQHSYSGLDDPDQAQQRPGFLDVRSLPNHVPTLGGVPSAGERSVVFFVRPAQMAGLLRAISHDRSFVVLAPFVIVTSGQAPGGREGTSIVADQGGRLSAAYGMRSPRDRGPAVGYAIVDRSGAVRYATLDPQVGTSLREVATIVRAVP